MVVSRGANPNRYAFLSSSPNLALLHSLSLSLAVSLFFRSNPYTYPNPILLCCAMVLILEALVEILRRPTVADVAVELAAFVAPLWIAVFAGLLLGWAWRPGWAAGLSGAVKTESAPSPGPHSAAPSMKAVEER